MNEKQLKYILSFLLLMNFLGTKAQIALDKKEVETVLHEAPSFSIYKDNYFITGIPLDRGTSKYTADAKFQLSFKQRMKNDPIFWGSYAYLTYTQKSFWGIYQDSSPFEETNYNPGVSFMKPIFKNERLLGALIYGIEHESNGRDGEDSRSWNFITGSYTHFFSKDFNVGLKLWLPFSYRDNRDLLDYIGYGEAHLSWNTPNQRLFLETRVRKSTRWISKGSIQTEVSWRPSMKRNFYLTLQWWEGYSESLIDYQKSVSMLRLGIALKPEMLRIY